MEGGRLIIDYRSETFPFCAPLWGVPLVPGLTVGGLVEQACPVGSAANDGQLMIDLTSNRAVRATDLRSTVPILAGEEGFEHIVTGLTSATTDGADGMLGEPSRLAFMAPDGTRTAIAPSGHTDTVWYLDVPPPDADVPGLAPDRTPTGLPFRIPTDASTCWGISTWADLLFGSIQLALFRGDARQELTPQVAPTIEDGVRISRHATVDPQVVVGRGTTIEAGALVTNSIIGQDCRIGQGCIVRNSILHEGVSLPVRTLVLMSVVHRNSVVNSDIRFSMVGEECFVGAGVFVTDVVLGRERLAEHPRVRTSDGSRIVETGSRVLGCALGPRTRIASGVIMNPGEAVPEGTTLLAEGRIR